MPANSKGKMVPNKTAGAKANSKTAGPNGSFPIGDAKHARLAIGAATRSKNAGNISAGEAAKIQREARAELAKDKGAASSQHPHRNLGAYLHPKKTGKK